MNISSERCGLILAAGFGSRLAGTVSSTTLKPLTPVAGVPLIFRTICSLEVAGCSKVVIVLGYKADEIRNQISEAYTGNLPLVFVQNDKYDLKNGVSVLAAKEHLSEVFVMTMADHVIGKSVMQLAGDHVPAQNGATLLVDYKISTIFDMDDATKVLSDESGKLISIGKTISDFNCIDTGVFICTSGLIEALEHFYTLNGDASLSEGVQQLAESHRMGTLDIGDGFWQDVDTPEMLQHAERVLKQNPDL